MEFLSTLQAQQDEIEKQKQLQEQLLYKSANSFVIQGTNVGLGAASNLYPADAASSNRDRNYSNKKIRRNDSVKKAKNKRTAQDGSLSSLLAHTGPASVKNVNSSSKAAVAGKRRNTGETFKCPYCRAQDGVGKLSFTTKGALTRHNNEKHAQKHYECDICRKTFARKYRLKTHYISHHAIHLSPSDLKLKAVSNVSYGQPAVNTYLKGSDPMLSSDSTASMLKRAYKATPSSTFFDKKRKGKDGYEQKIKRAKKNPEIDDVQAAWDLLGMMHCM